MSYSHFKINGTPIKTPTSFKIERYKVTKAERTLDAKMKQELIAKKLKFYFTYEAIEARDLNIILDIIWESNDLFYTLEYEDGNSNSKKSARVYVGSIPTDLGGGDASNWVWKDVSFNLIEQ